MQNHGYYTDYNMTAFTKPDCSGTAKSYWRPVHASDPLVNDDYLYQTGCYDSLSGSTWQSYYVWNIAAYENLYSAGGEPALVASSWEPCRNLSERNVVRQLGINYKIAIRAFGRPRKIWAITELGTVVTDR